jgi:hypothetical protein
VTKPNHHTREAFAQHIRQAIAPLEARRQALLRYFWAFSVLFVALQLLFWLNGWPEAPAFALPDPINFSTIWPMICGAIVWLIALGAWLLPIIIAAIPFFYHGKTRGIGLNPQHFSLKDTLFSNIIRFFGTWDYAPDAKILGQKLNGSIIFPQYDQLEAEDLFHATASGCTAWIGEVTAIRLLHRVRHTAFHGLVMVVDISDTQLALRAPFTGHSVLLTDANKTAAFAERFASYARVPLPTHALEEAFELFSTHPHEAAKLVSAPLLEQLVRVHHVLQHATQQHQHVESALSYGVQSLFKQEATTRGLADFEKAMLAKLDISKQNPPSADAMLYQQSVQIEWMDERCIITLPYMHDLFEPNSMFSPPLVAEDAEILWQTVHALHAVCAHIHTVSQTPPA